jgi:hypothetical protein
VSGYEIAVTARILGNRPTFADSIGARPGLFGAADGKRVLPPSTTRMGPALWRCRSWETHWQIAFAGLMLLTLILALGIVWMGARTKVIPYVVEVDKLGYAITIPTALTASSTATSVERMKRYEIAAFIRNARSVCSDRNFEICLQRLARTLRDAT